MPHICKASPDGCANCNHPQATLDVDTCPGYGQGWVCDQYLSQCNYPEPCDSARLDCRKDCAKY